MAIVKPSWLEAVEHALGDACSTVQHCSESHPEKNKHPNVWVACSGGLDSCVLLDICAKWAAQYAEIELGVIHINHQLSPNAAQWQQHVEELANAYNLKCVSKQVSILEQPRESLECQARDARYTAIFETLKDHHVLVLGQHLDDQVETVFMRLLRGSGPKGLAGIRLATQRSYGADTFNLVRPLLAVSRVDLEMYANTHGLRWVTDESNDNLVYDRNMVRHKWLKVAQQHWPERWSGMQKAIARSAQLCEQQQTALELLLTEKLQIIQTSTGTLSRSKLLALPSVLQTELIRFWLSEQTHEMPSAAVLEQIHTALTCEPDKSPVIKWGQHECRIYRDDIHFLRHQFESRSVKAKLSSGQSITFQDALGESIVMSCQITDHNLTLSLNYIHSDVANKRLTLSSLFNHKQPQSITIANDLGEYYFTASVNGKSRQLKRWFKDWKIPPWYRSNLVGVFVGNTLVAVIQHRDIKPNYKS